MVAVRASLSPEKPSTAMAAKSAALSSKWFFGAACDTPSPRARERRLTAAGPSTSMICRAAAFRSAARSAS